MIDAQRSKLATALSEDDHQRHHCCCCSPSPWLLMSLALRGRCCAFCYIEQQKEVEERDKDPILLNKMDQQHQRLINCSRQVLEATTKLAHRLSSTISVVSEPAATLSRKRCSLLVSIVLPLILVLLLPSQIKLEHSSNSAEQLSKALSVDKLLLSLLRFPFDRLRFVSGLTPVAAKEINSKHDLQEEETHLQMKAPTSERSGYHLSQSQMTNYQQQQQQQPLRQTQRQQQAALEQQQAGYGNTQVVNQVVQPQQQQQEQSMAPHQSEGHYGGSDYATGNGVAQSEGANLESAPNESGATTADQSVGSSSGGTALVGPSSGLQTRADLPAVRALNVKCEKNHMTVNIVFDRPFYGMVFSKGHYNDQKCVHLPANSGQTSANFDIHLGKCGMSSSDASGAQGTTQLQQSTTSANNNNNGQQPNGLYIENVIIIQYDPQVQEIYDQARKLRCTWYDYYEKSVTFRPYNVDMLDAVTANFLGDNIQCWMQIQVGKGPWSSEVAGIVKIGQTMTMVLAIKDDENRFDMLVRNCVAHDGKHQPIQLVDEYGCVARPKIMAKFQKVRNFGPAATVVSYAHFQAFKFPDSMSVHFQCVIQVCRYECPEPVCSGNGAQQSTTGADLPGISGGGSSSGNGGGASDYAASGTEIVASKEPLPNGLGSINIGGEQSAVNLKLDESQGRVQVKLDTSMMAGLGPQVRANSLAAQSGPLPPHLLHLGAAEPLLSNSGGGNSRSPISIGNAIGRGGNIFHSSSSSGAGAAFQRSATPAPPGGAGASNVGRPAMVNRAQSAQVAPSGNSQTHYSAPFPAQQQQQQHLYQRNVYTATNRVGELALSELELDASRSTDSSLHINPISGSPRALRLAPSTTPPTTTNSNLTTQQQQQQQRRSPPAPNHRYRRALRTLPDFTDVQTQKTIQVVSPDDVAFSLLSDDLEPPTVFGSSSSSSSLASQRQRSAIAAEHLASTVCFSATRLMAGLLVALAALAASVAVVATLLLRQRWQRNLLEANKLYELDTDHLSVAQSSGDLSPLSGGAQMATQRAAGSFNQHQHLAANSTHLHHEHHRQQKQQRLLLSSRRLEDEAIMSRRQQDELQHRNNYLARLYSQFVPATYWR